MLAAKIESNARHIPAVYIPIKNNAKICNHSELPDDIDPWIKYSLGVSYQMQFDQLLDLVCFNSSKKIAGSRREGGF